MTLSGRDAENRYAMTARQMRNLYAISAIRERVISIINYKHRGAAKHTAELLSEGGSVCHICLLPSLAQSKAGIKQKDRRS